MISECAPRPLHPSTITSGHESRTLIPSSSFYREKPFNLYAQTSTEANWKMEAPTEAPNVAWEQRTHPAGTVQNEVAHRSWTTFAEMVTVKTCFRTAEGHNVFIATQEKVSSSHIRVTWSDWLSRRQKWLHKKIKCLNEKIRGGP